MNKQDFLNQIKQRLKDKSNKEHLDTIKYLQEYDEEKETKKLNRELKRNLILNEEI